MDRHLRHVVQDGRRLDVQQLQHRRHEVRDVVVLVAQAGLLDPGRPVDDQRIADAAAVGVLLVPLERRVAGLGPAGRVVDVGGLVAEPVDRLQAELQRLRDVAGVRLVDVEAADARALVAGAVVRHQHDHRVVKLADLLQVVDQPADLGVGVVQEAGVDLHLAGGDPLLVRRELVPGRHVLVERRQLGARPARCPAPSASPATRRAPRPSRRRTCHGTCRCRRRAPGAASAPPRTRRTGRTACRWPRSADRGRTRWRGRSGRRRGGSPADVACR